MPGISAKPKLGPLLKALKQQEKNLAKAVTGGMGDATDALKQSLRDMVKAAGLGTKLAYTWRGRVYPDKAVSLHPKGLVYVRPPAKPDAISAPAIMQAYDSGADIVPLNGSKYLAIPAAAARRITGRKGSRMTVAQVEAALKTRIVIIKGRNGNLLGLYDPRTKALRKRGSPRSLILLYTFVPLVKVRKRINVASVVAVAGQRIPAFISARIDA